MCIRDSTHTAWVICRQLEINAPRIGIDLKNATVAVKEWKNEVIFLHEVRQGAADRSYGLQVAKLAGLPATVIDRANVILNELEKRDMEKDPAKKLLGEGRKDKSGDYTKGANLNNDQVKIIENSLFEFTSLHISFAAVSASINGH